MIELVHGANYGVYGARKIHAEVRRQGHQFARCTVERLMRTAGLWGITRAKGPRTTAAGTGPETRPDLVKRDRAGLTAGKGVRPALRCGHLDSSDELDGLAASAKQLSARPARGAGVGS